MARNKIILFMLLISSALLLSACRAEEEAMKAPKYGYLSFSKYLRLSASLAEDSNRVAFSDKNQYLILSADSSAEGWDVSAELQGVQLSCSMIKGGGEFGGSLMCTNDSLVIRVYRSNFVERSASADEVVLEYVAWKESSASSWGRYVSYQTYYLTSGLLVGKMFVPFFVCDDDIAGEGCMSLPQEVWGVDNIMPKNKNFLHIKFWNE